MAEVMTGVYLGSKKVELTHETSGTHILTDAPKDNHGDGSSFSPTDLVAAALGSCMMTVMGIGSDRLGVDLSGMRMEVEKHMNAAPRRIGRLPLKMHMPRNIKLEDRPKLEHIGKTCPVAQSLHPDVKVEIEFLYDV